MKRLPVLLCAGVSLLITLPSPAQKNQSSAADPFIKIADNPAAATEAGSWRNCMLVLEVYAMGKDDALAVLEAGIGSAARYKQVLELAKGGKARLEILTALNSKNGNRAILELIKEVRYPTAVLSGTAKNYEMHNAGDTIEFEAAINPDQRTCTLSFVPASTRTPGSPLPAPRLSVRKTTTTIAFPINEAHFFGTLSEAPERGGFGGEQMVSLAFMRVNVTSPGSDQVKSPAKAMDWSALTLEYTFYSLDRAAARELLVASPSLDGPWKAVQALLGEKKARFEHVVSLQTQSGHKSVMEEMQELYSLVEPVDVRQLSQIASHDSATKPAEEDASKRLLETDTNSTVPERFDKRNTGLTVEAEPAVNADGLSISLNQAIQSVTAVGDFKMAAVAGDFSAHAVFETRHVTNSQTLLAGQKTFVSTFSPADADEPNKQSDRTWLLFVRATPNEP